jgi:hypothetical protein
MRFIIASSLALIAAGLTGCTGPVPGPYDDYAYVQLPGEDDPTAEHGPGQTVGRGVIEDRDTRTVARPGAPSGVRPIEATPPPAEAEATKPEAPGPARSPAADSAAERKYREVLGRRMKDSTGGAKVRVVGADGTPATDVHVRYFNLAWSWEGGDLFPFVATDISEARTDGEGVAAFPRAGTRAIFAYVESSAGVDCGVMGSSGKGRRPQDLELKLGPGKVLRGRVLGADGQPVVGASVEFHRSFTDRFLDLSRADGRFAGVRLPERYHAGTWRLRVGAPGFVLHEREVDASSLAVGTPITVTLERE